METLASYPRDRRIKFLNAIGQVLSCDLIGNLDMSYFPIVLGGGSPFDVNRDFNRFTMDLIEDAIPDGDAFEYIKPIMRNVREAAHNEKLGIGYLEAGEKILHAGNDIFMNVIPDGDSKVYTEISMRTIAVQSGVEVKTREILVTTLVTTCKSVDDLPWLRRRLDTIGAILRGGILEPMTRQEKIAASESTPPLWIGASLEEINDGIRGGSGVYKLPTTLIEHNTLRNHTKMSAITKIDFFSSGK